MERINSGLRLSDGAPYPYPDAMYYLIALLALLLAACTAEPPTAQGRTAVTFRDCEVCPLMVEIPAGEFLMGTAAEDRLIDPRTGKPATNDSPQHRVTLANGFALGRYEVSVGEYAAFVAATGYDVKGKCMGFATPNKFTMSDKFDWRTLDAEQSDQHPVGCVSYYDAAAYAEWLSEQTGKGYRLPTEAQWEYAARAGSTGNYHWGRDAESACTYANIRSPGAKSISDRQAKSDETDGFPCDDGYPNASPVGSFQPNDFGLHDMQGNAWEWVADCNHKDYQNAPTDGSAWLDDKGCQFGLIRSGSYLNRVERSSATVRVGRPRSGRGTNMGFRVAVGSGTEGIGGSVAADVAARSAQFDDGSAGALLFNEHCEACHQQRANFLGVYGKDQAAVEGVIRDGGNNVMSMPTFAEVLTAPETTTLATYLRSVNGWE
ncbi:MAG: SUMF1/EgtB/PvdO family nonheme iron enzyme [Gammaproteobacteria bacterium]